MHLVTATSNQKRVLYNFIFSYLRPANTMLDIGAGDGILALELSKIVSAYTAIEKNSKNCANLKNAGLSFFVATF